MKVGVDVYMGQRERKGIHVAMMVGEEDQFQHFSNNLCFKTSKWV